MRGGWQGKEPVVGGGGVLIHAAQVCFSLTPATLDSAASFIVSPAVVVYAYCLAFVPYTVQRYSICNSTPEGWTIDFHWEVVVGPLPGTGYVFVGYECGGVCSQWLCAEL